MSPLPHPKPLSQSCAGGPCPAADATLSRLLNEATRWATYVSSGTRSAGLSPFKKALDAVSFTLRTGLGTFAVPTKLIGVKAHQAAVRALRVSGARAGLRLHLEERGGRLAVLWGNGRLLGYVQPKHERWLRPLVGTGVEVRLIAVTGDEAKSHTLGVNIALCSLPHALTRLSKRNTSKR